MPSRTDSFGIVFLEAWMYDVPVIGARAGGVPDVIDDGENGMLINFGDVAALSAHIQRLIDDKPMARRLGMNGHSKVLRELTFAEKYQQMKAIYEEAIRSHSA
jgi:glycosyltransferase involved in cell wall biosynthesis